MRILHISSTDAAGGAAAAAWRLHQKLRERGVDSRMLVGRKTKADSSVTVFDSSGGRKVLWSLVEAGAIWRNRSELSDSLFSSGYPGVDVSNHPEVLQADVLHLHWVTDFLSSGCLVALSRGPRPVVWTLHDQRPFTGGCHFSAGCQGYTATCYPCPQLSNQFGEMPSRNLSDARASYRGQQMTLVSPSRWMKTCASASRVFSGGQEACIPNGISQKDFNPMDRRTARRELGLPVEGFYVLFGAAALSERRKGGRQFLEAAKRLLQKAAARILTFGDQGDFLSELGEAMVPLGFLGSAEELRRAYAAADVFALASLDDNLPNTMLEAMACGTPVVGFDVGGVPDAVESGLTGRLVEKGNIQAFADALWEYSRDVETAWRHGDAAARKVAKEFSLDLQADRYLALYAEAPRLPEIPPVSDAGLGPSLREGFSRIVVGAMANLSKDMARRLGGAIQRKP
jgi:glycosyltransferase involved in cell wall biosynthesis